MSVINDEIIFTGLCAALETAIEREISGSRVSAKEMHSTMRSLYAWPDVAERTERVYDAITEQGSTRNNFAERVQK